MNIKSFSDKFSENTRITKYDKFKYHITKPVKYSDNIMQYARIIPAFYYVFGYRFKYQNQGFMSILSTIENCSIEPSSMHECLITKSLKFSNIAYLD